MRGVHLPLLEQSMQSNRQSSIPLETVEESKASSASKLPLVILDTATLERVAGGLSPKGTWGADSVVTDTAASPKGTW